VKGIFGAFIVTETYFKPIIFGQKFGLMKAFDLNLGAVTSSHGDDEQRKSRVYARIALIGNNDSLCRENKTRNLRVTNHLCN
jgi:hypothetical protein